MAQDNPNQEEDPSQQLQGQPRVGQNQPDQQVGYAAYSDKTFVSYNADKQNEWEQGKELTSQKLMDLALGQHIKTNEIWNAPSADQEKIMALEAKDSESNRSLKNREKQSTTKEENETGKKAGTKKYQGKERPAWMTTEPPEAELRKPKLMDGKEWFWCSNKTGGKCPGSYRQHKPSQCKYDKYCKKQRTQGDKKARRSQKAGKHSNKPKVVIVQAANKDERKAKAAELQGGHISDQRVEHGKSIRDRIIKEVHRRILCFLTYCVIVFITWLSLTPQ